MNDRRRLGDEELASVEELRALVSVATQASHADILASLVTTLGRTLGFKVVFVCEMGEPDSGSAHTLALCESGELKENFEYPLAGTPCEMVYEQKEIFYRQDLQKHFPADHYLRETGSQSYLGLVFRNADDELIGHIGVMHDRPLDERACNHPLFRAFAARAQAELERRHADDKLRQQALDLASVNAHLERANRELEEFAYITSHDLKEPLRGLVSYSQLLRDDLGPGLAPQVSQDLEFIENGARRMQQLVGDLLDLSRAANAPIERRPTSVDACVDRALEALSLRVREMGARIERPPLPEIVADATLLTSVYQNLLENALRFSGGHAPRIELTVERAQEGYVLGVADRGPGIPAEQRDAIFRPFKRLGPRSEHGGSGIGLAICRRAVERHGGTIWVEDWPGGGVRFQFTLGDRS